MPDCFIVMPISTPPHMVEAYGGDRDHFLHVLEHLFCPAIEAAGFKPISPVAQGADLIHAEIIRHLETDEMVLCDMSCLNANVFFELGIRTAVNKPVCSVLDSLPVKIPFDAGIVNYSIYDASLSPWTLKKEIEKLRAHIRAAAERSGGKNQLWKYFSLKGEAKLEISESPMEEKIDLILQRMEHLGERSNAPPTTPFPKDTNLLKAYLDNFCRQRDPEIEVQMIGTNSFRVVDNNVKLSNDDCAILFRIAEERRASLKIAHGHAEFVRYPD